VNSFTADRAQELELHPTVKPVAMIADAIKDVSRRADIVLDPFGGSGSTLIAAHKTGRRAFIMEIDPVYCARAIRRWEIYAKDNAVQLACGWPCSKAAVAPPTDHCPAVADQADPAPATVVTKRPKAARRVA
jgi:hypothetical protein